MKLIVNYGFSYEVSFILVIFQVLHGLTEAQKCQSVVLQESSYRLRLRRGVVAASEVCTAGNETVYADLDEGRSLTSIIVQWPSVPIINDVAYSYNNISRFTVSSEYIQNQNGTIRLTQPVYGQFFSFNVIRNTSERACFNYSFTVCTQNIIPSINVTASSNLLSTSLNISCVVDGQAEPRIQLYHENPSRGPLSAHVRSSGGSSLQRRHYATLTLYRGSNVTELERMFSCNYRMLICTGVFTCSAGYLNSNRTGADSVLVRTQLSLPGKPDSLLVQRRSNSTVLVTWQPPLMVGDFAITSFNLSYEMHGAVSARMVFIPFVKSTMYSVVLNNLSPCKNYSIRIRAVTGFGDGVVSELIYLSSSDTRGVNLTSTGRNSTSVTLTWMYIPVLSGCEATHPAELNVTYSCKNAVSDGNLPGCQETPMVVQLSGGSLLSYTQTRLLPDRIYQFFIVTRLFSVPGAVVSNTIDVQTTEDSPTGTVRNATIANLTGSSVEIRWLPISKVQQNGQIVSYRFSYKPPFGNTIVQNLNANVRSFNVSDLSDCFTYTFSLAGCTGVGCGPEVVLMHTTGLTSNSSVKLTAEDKTGDAASFASVLLIVSHNVDLRCIQGYEVAHRISGSSWQVTLESKGSGTFTSTISSLNLFTDYEFRARLVLSVGKGDWSEIVKLKTRSGKPSPMRSLQVVSITSDSATLSWLPPLKLNGVPNAYIFTVRGTRSYDPSFQHRDLFSRAPSATQTVLQLRHATSYVLLAAFRNSNYLSVAIPLAFQTAAKVPPTPSFILLSPSISNTITAVVTIGAVRDTSGPVSDYEVIVLRHNASQRTLPASFANTLHDFSTAMSRKLNFYIAARIAKFEGQQNFTVGSGTVSNGYTNRELDRDADYSIYCRSVITWNGKRVPSVLSSVELYRYSEPVLTPVSNATVTDRSFTVNLFPISSGVAFVRIILLKLQTDASGKALLPTSPSKSLLDSDLLTYDEAKAMSTDKAYVTAELHRSYFKKHRNYTVGDGSRSSKAERFRRNLASSTSFVNGPLTADSFYSYFFRIYYIGGVNFSTSWGPSVSTNPAHKQSKPLPKPSNLGVGLSIGVAVVIIFAIAIVGFVFWRTSRKYFTERDRSDTTELKTHELYLNNYHDNYAFEKGDLGMKPLSNDEPRLDVPFVLSYTTDTEHPPIKVSEFPDYVSRLRQNAGFEEEFLQLDSGLLNLCTAARQKENSDKNRYDDIVPYDDSRVILRLDRKGRSDYINASYIDSYLQERFYIAAQGPLKPHFKDFWEMIWQEEVRTIIAIGELTQNGTPQFNCYWPSSNEADIPRYGNVHVSAKVPEVAENFIMRPFVVQYKQEPLRDIRQYHLLEWPTKDTPGAAQMLLTFRREMRHWHAQSHGRILVHCGAGIGRTGAFIALDSILDNAKTSRSVDIFNFVNHLRRQRVNMVKTVEQYELLHEVVVEALTHVQSEVEMTNSNMNTVIERLNSIDSVTGYTGFRKLFKQQNRSVPSPAYFDKFDGHKPINEYKNRYSNKVPTDKHRWKFDSVSNDKESDYINATSFDDLSSKLRIITTQAPFGMTMADFWKMVQDCSAKVIVMLNETHEDAGVFPEYWPTADTQSLTHGDLKISLELESSPISGVTKREFNLSNKNKYEEEKEVQHYHLHGWPDRNIPNTRGPVLALVDLLLNNHASDIDPPIIIHCSDGLGRSGVFAAILAAAKTYLRRRSVNIPQIVSELRLHHPYFIETESQFRFVFDVVRDFISMENSKETTRL